MKILQIVDPHSATGNPESRIDNYYDTFRDKFRVVNKVIETKKVDAVVFNGDFFHHKDPSRTPYHLFNWWENEIHMITTLGARVFWIRGNHDYRSMDLDTWKNQPLYNLFYSPVDGKLANHIGGMVAPFTSRSGDQIYFLGYDHLYEFDSEGFDFQKFKDDVKKVKDSLSNVKLCLVIHQAVFPDGKRYPFFYRNLSSFVGCGADYIMCGHIHDELGLLEYESGKFFLNFGSVMRGSVHEYNLKRIPKVAVLDTVTNQVETFDLTTKTADRVFNLDAIAESKREESDLKAFAAELGKLENIGEEFQIDVSALTPLEQGLYETYLNSVSSKQEARRESVQKLIGDNLFDG